LSSRSIIEVLVLVKVYTIKEEALARRNPWNESKAKNIKTI